MRINFDITGDNTNLVTTLNDTTKRLESLSDLMRDLGSAGLDMSNPKAQLKSLNTAIRENEKVIKDYVNQLRELEKAQREAAASGKTTEVNSIGAKMAEIAGRMQSTIVETNTLKNAYGELSSTMNRAGGVMQKFLGGAENYKAILSQLPPGLRMVTTELNAMTGAAKAFIATPLGVVLAGLLLSYKALDTWLNKTADGQMVLAGASGYLNGVLVSLEQVVKDLGHELYKLFTEPKEAAKDFLTFIEKQFIVRFKAFYDLFKDIGSIGTTFWNLAANKGSFAELGQAWKEVFSNIGNDLVALTTGFTTEQVSDFIDNLDEAGQKGKTIGERELELRKKRSAWQVQEAKLDKEIAEQRNKIYTGSTEERAQAAARAEELINKKYAKRIELAREEFNIQKEKNSWAENSIEEIDAKNRLEAQIIREQGAKEGELRMFTRRGHSADEAGIKAEQKAENELTSLMLENEQKRIAMIEDEAEREAAAIELKYKKEIEAVKRRRKEWEEANRLATGNSALSDEQEKALVEAEKIAEEERADANKKSNKALIDQYKGYWEQRKDILLKGIQEALELEALGETEAAENRRKETAKQVNALDRQNKEIYKKLAKDRSTWLVSDVTELLTGLQKELDALVKEDNPDIEYIQRLRGEIESLKKELSQSFTPAGLLKTLLQPDEEGNGKSFKQRIQSIKDAWDAMTAEQKWQTVGGYVAKIGEGLQKAADYMREIAELNGDSGLADTAKELSAAAQNLTAAGQGAASGGWIGAIVGGVADILGQTIEAFTNVGLQEAIAAKNAREWGFAIETAFLNIDESKFDSIFGTKSISKAQANFKKAESALAMYGNKITEINEKYQKQNFLIDKDTDNFTGYDLFLPIIGSAIYRGSQMNVKSNEWTAYKDAIEKGQTGLQKMLIKTKEQTGWAKFWGAQDEYTSLGSLAPEIWDENGELIIENARKFLEVNTQISEEQRREIEQLIELREGYEEAMKVVDDTISETFGNLASDLTDIIWDSVMTGTDAWEQFQEVGSEAIASLGKQMIQEMLISEYLEQYREQMRAAYQLSSPEETQKELRNITASIFGGMEQMLAAGSIVAEEYKAWAEANGFDLAKLANEQQTVKAGGFETMSQDTATELNGRFTALQISNEMISQTAQEGLTYIITISDLVTAGNSTLSEIRNLHTLELAQLEDIAKYTKVMVGFGEKLDQIQENTSKL